MKHLGNMYAPQRILFPGPEAPYEASRQYTPHDAFYFLGQRAPYEASRQYTPHDAFYFLGQRAPYDASRQYTPHHAFYSWAWLQLVSGIMNGMSWPLG